jgi:regulator of PEP synthase PpsR (kinase-PPPase family)
VENARKLARDHGFTEIDVTGRAMEETATLIVSKLKERFPEMQ